MDTLENHSELIIAAMGLKKLSADQITELDDLEKLAPIVQAEHAFTRIATVADLHDALVLYLSGVNVSYEPFQGGLGGFAQAVDLTTTRRVSAAPVPFKGPAKWKSWNIVLEDDSPASIAGALVKLLTNKNRAPNLHIDLTKLPAGKRAEAIAHALTGAANLLNWRAARTLSVCDIADLLEWFSGLSDARLDGQLPYGHREWGPFVSRRVTDHLEHRPNPVISPLTNRSIIMFVDPKKTDLEGLVAWSKKARRSFGLINGRTYAPVGKWPCGMSPDKTLRLGHHTLLGVVSGDMSGAATIEEARERAKLLARGAYRQTLKPVPAGLQSSWTEQKDLHRLTAIRFRWDLEEHPVSDLTNHADNAAYQQADELRRLRCERVQVVEPVEHRPPTDALKLDWNTFVAANFRP